MKKITLLLSFALAAVSFSQAQNLKIIYQGGTDHNYLNDSTILVYGSSTVSFFPSPTFDVINKSSDSANLWVKRTIISALPTTTNAICFAGYCGAVTQGASVYSCNIGAGDTAELGNAFYGDYYPNNQVGVTTIRYTFYNYNYADSGSFIIKYITGPAGIALISAGQIGFSVPYPNPASNNVNFSYSLINGVQSANLKIFDLLGKCIQTLPLNTSKNKTTVDVQTMPSGVYICEIQAEGCQPAYQKMIVSH